jgi:hypothetical protein
MMNFNLSTIEYTDSNRHDLILFCESCRQSGYKNNETLSAIRLEECLSQGGQFFLTYLDDTLISISGCHPLPQVGPQVFRVLFRGVVLKEYQNLFGLVSKTHMTSIPFYYHLPLQLEWARSKGYKDICITTNWNNPDGITSMNHSHKVLQLLERQGIVESLIDKIHLFHTDQTVWRVNIENYFIARNKFKERNELH